MAGIASAAYDVAKLLLKGVHTGKWTVARASLPQTVVCKTVVFAGARGYTGTENC